jgi:hypothetical protein
MKKTEGRKSRDTVSFAVTHSGPASQVLAYKVYVLYDRRLLSIVTHCMSSGYKKIATACQMVTQNGNCMSGGYTKWPLPVRWLHKITTTAFQVITHNGHCFRWLHKMATAFQAITHNGPRISGGVHKRPLHFRWLHKMATAF